MKIRFNFFDVVWHGFMLLLLEAIIFGMYMSKSASWWISTILAVAIAVVMFAFYAAVNKKIVVSQEFLDKCDELYPTLPQIRKRAENGDPFVAHMIRATIHQLDYQKVLECDNLEAIKGAAEIMREREKLLETYFQFYQMT